MPSEHVDEVRDGVEAGQGVGLGDAHGAQVGGLAGAKRADLVVEPEGTGAIKGGHAEGAVGGQGGGVAGDQLGEKAGLLHLAEEVEPVVAGSAVGAEPDVQAPVEQPGSRGGTAGELHVGGGAVGDGAVVERQALDVAVVEVDGMHADQVGAEQAELIEPELFLGATAEAAMNFARVLAGMV